MRLLFGLPFVLSALALILSFTCIFAGSNPGFAEDAPILEFNTSRIGSNWLHENDPNYPKTTLVHNITEYLDEHIWPWIPKNKTSLANPLGLQDWYTVHFLGYCEGSFSPFAVKNGSKVSRIVADCYTTKGFYAFNPVEAMQNSLLETHTGVTLGDLGLPAKIVNGMHNLAAGFKAAFFFYIIGIIATFLYIISLSLWISTHVATRLPLVKLEIIFSDISWFCIGLASAILSGVMDSSTSLIDKLGKPIGVSAYRGGKFMAMTWCATFLMVFTAAISFYKDRVHKQEAFLRGLENEDRLRRSTEKRAKSRTSNSGTVSSNDTRTRRTSGVKGEMSEIGIKKVDANFQQEAIDEGEEIIFH